MSTPIRKPGLQLTVRQLPWITPNNIPPACTQHPLIGCTLQTFQKACRTLHISSTQGSMTPIRNNPEFPTGMSDTFLKDSWPHTDIRTEHFFSGDTFLSLPSLPTKTTDRPFPRWTYLQIRHFLNHPHKRSEYARQLTPFEQMCTKTKPQRHVISEIYSLLFSDHDPKSNIATCSWERELSIDLSEEDWENIYTYIHKGIN